MVQLVITTSKSATIRERLSVRSLFVFLYLTSAAHNQEIYVLPAMKKNEKDEFGFGRGEKGMLAWVGWALNNGSALNDTPFLRKGDLGTIILNFY